MIIKLTVLLLTMLCFAPYLWSCGPCFPASFIDCEDGKISQFGERELLYHFTLLQERFLSNCVPPSPRSKEIDPVEMRQEYNLYELGIKEITDNPKCSFPIAWKKLLALPTAKRRYRTVRTYYMLGNLAVRNDKNYSAAYGYYQKLRQEVINGFPDNLGLSMDSIRAQVRYFKGAWFCRALAIQARYGIFKDPLSSELKIFKASITPENKKEMLADPFLAEVLLLASPSLVKDCNHKFLLADRLAMRAFQTGNFALTEQLLKQSPDYSLIKLYLQAKLSRRNGQYKTAAEYLKKWLELYNEKVGYIPPEVKFSRHTSDGDMDYSWKQEIHGVLGLIAIERKDFQEALLGFACADSWHDAALIAEQYLSTEELKIFVKANTNYNSIIPLHISKKLRHLLARRLLRENRFDEAILDYFPNLYHEAVKEYLHCRKRAENLKLPIEIRAQNYFRCGQILLYYNIELLGYELAPDYKIVNGNFTLHPPFQMTKNIQLSRFHYRKTIADCFKNSAKLTQNADFRFMSYLIGGWVLKDLTPQDANYFYKAIVNMKNYPASQIFEKLRWFPKALPHWKKRVYLEINPFLPETINNFLKMMPLTSSHTTKKTI